MMYEKLFQADGSFLIRQVRDDGKMRLVDEDYHGYAKWMADKLPINEIPYVAPVENIVEPDAPAPEKTVSEKLSMTDPGMISVCARMLEDIAEERLAAGKYVHQHIKDAIGKRKDLRAQL